MTAIAGLALAGCASGDSGTEAPADAPRVIMVAYPTGDAFYDTIESSAREEAEASGVDLTIQKMPTYEASAQISIVNAALATNPDALIVSPVDLNVLQNTLEKASEAGVKIVLYDTTTKDPSVAVTQVSADTVELGRLGAEEFVRLVGDASGSVFYQSTAAGQPYFEALQTGWTEVLDEHTNLKQLPVNYSDFEPTKAGSQMEAVLTSNSDLLGGFAGIFLDQQGNIPAIERAGKAGDLAIIAHGGAPENIERLKAGLLDALVSEAAADYGVQAVRAAVAAINGEDVPEKTVIGQCLLTAENIDDPENAPCVWDGVVEE